MGLCFIIILQGVEVEMCLNLISRKPRKKKKQNKTKRKEQFAGMFQLISVIYSFKKFERFHLKSRR